MYIILLILYSTIPVFIRIPLFRYIYPKKISDPSAWHVFYMIELLTAVSYLPILYFKDINLGLIPASNFSVFLYILSICLPIFGIIPALKHKSIKLYTSGVYAGFMEEILFRGIIFGLAKAIWNNNLIAIIVSSLAFGVWHLKNVFWLGKRRTIRELFYTAFIFGPIFCFERILIGDLSLAILHHIITDAIVALTPAKYRWFIIDGQHGEETDDFVGRD